MNWIMCGFALCASDKAGVNGPGGHFTSRTVSSVTGLMVTTAVA